MKFGVIGLGSVGWSIIHGLSKYFAYIAYDIEGEYSWEEILGADIIFICVNTPLGKDMRLDCSAVSSVLERLNFDDYKGITVIKSTLKVGYMKKARVKYPLLRITYMPEFLRERNSFSWFLNPSRLVISGDKEDVSVVLTFFDWVTKAEILIVDDISAEIGKLAHNAFIATKVSFTNEIEALSQENSADPFDVMKIVWTDRRIMSSDHLIPGLGPYGGKCVPKDTLELINSSNKTELLRTVNNVNVNSNRSPKEYELNKVALIIPTKQDKRHDLIRRAISSVKSQTIKPDITLVVYDKNEGLHPYIQQIIKEFSNQMKIQLIENKRSQNLSGAVNTGIYYLEKNIEEINKYFIAILDDDDWWDRRYLENCLKFSRDFGLDWVVSGLIRHDRFTPDGRMERIPEKISIDDFLVGNPNVQGSNLFVLLDKILNANGFDEKLVSTTDRDICISLLKLENIKYGILRNHLVHHDALERNDRLSTKGSLKKQKGLTYFFKKYHNEMSEEQKKKFKKRVKEVFEICMDN